MCWWLIWEGVLSLLNLRARDRGSIGWNEHLVAWDGWNWKAERVGKSRLTEMMDLPMEMVGQGKRCCYVESEDAKWRGGG